MTTYIKKSTEVQEAVATTQHSIPHSEVEFSVKKRRSRVALRITIAMSVLGLGLALSAICNFLLFKELLLASAFVGLAMWLKAARPPVVTVSKQSNGRAHLN